MLNAINFPNLGIELESVGRSVSFLGLEISYYGLLMALAILVGMGVILLEVRYTGQHVEDYIELAIVTIPLAILGARIFYILFGFEFFKGSIFRIFAIWNGGYAFYGALLGGLIAIAVYTNFRNMWTAEVLDTVTLGLLAGQVIASWGSYFNRESFGEYTDGLFAMQLPIEGLRIADVTDRMRNYLVEIDGVKFVQVKPLFLYQSIFCLILLICLFVYRYNKEFDGEIFSLYLAVYSIFRILIEFSRTDALTTWILKLPASGVAALICLLGSVGFIIYHRRMDGKGRMRRMRQKNALQSLSNKGNMFH